jgi:hypothetical protein
LPKEVISAVVKDGHLPGDKGNGSGGDGAVMRIHSPADAADARCGFGIRLFDSNYPAELCISFAPIPDFSGPRSAPL